MSSLRSLASEDEDKVIWKEDIEKLDYVREATTVRCNRTRPISFGGSKRRLVGYTTVKKGCSGWGESRVFFRRFFYLCSHDRDSDPNGCYKTGSPYEGVDPRTVHPGISGLKTKRVYGEEN